MTHPVAPWSDLDEVLGLEIVAPGHYRSTRAHGNANGRVFGGQLIGQIAAAGQAHAPADRPIGMLQMTFLRGARVGEPIDYHVETVQHGKRVATVHVSGVQAGTGVVAGHVSFQQPQTFDQWQAMAPALRPAPEELPDGMDHEPAHGARLHAAGFGGFLGGDTIQFRFVDPDHALQPLEPGTDFRLWIRVATALPDDRRVHDAALAYLSDWWFAYASLGPCITAHPGRGLYVASLNHTMWFHAPCRADEWLLYSMRSLHIGGGRGLNFGQVHRRDGVLVATTTQECLQAPRESAG